MQQCCNYTVGARIVGEMVTHYLLCQLEQQKSCGGFTPPSLPAGPTSLAQGRRGSRWPPWSLPKTPTSATTCASQRDGNLPHHSGKYHSSATPHRKILFKCHTIRENIIQVPYHSGKKCNSSATPFRKISFKCHTFQEKYNSSAKPNQENIIQVPLHSGKISFKCQTNQEYIIQVQHHLGKI